mmetsp:Transcript_708/g.2091  ORF Transcript_708/g.2091 Transcript_708/m.2091 type:complete len:416 (-) Transcript_708:200-1447(-)
MSSHLVERAEEDSYTAVSQHVGTLLNEGEAETTELADTPGSQFAADCMTLISEGRLADLLSRLLSKAEVIFSKAQDKDLECCIHVICHLAARVPDAPAAAESVAQALSAKVDAQQEARLQGLGQLFNVVTDSTLQYHVLLELLKFSKASGQAHAMMPIIRANMESWPTDLNLSPQQTRTLYQLSADVLRSSKRKVKTAQRDAYKLTLKMLESLDRASPAEVAQYKGAAAAAAADFIKSPDAFQFDMAATPAVQQLQGDSQHGPLFQLLQLLLSGSVQDFQAFAEENPGVFEAAGTSQEEALTKMRLMALLGLGAHPHPVPLADVQASLKVGDGEVEAWIVRAVGKKLLDAKMDQTAGTVAVTRCSHRSFGPSQWLELSDRLALWKANVSGVRALVSEQAANGTGSLPAMQAAIRA